MSDDDVTDLNQYRDKSHMPLTRWAGDRRVTGSPQVKEVVAILLHKLEADLATRKPNLAYDHNKTAEYTFDATSVRAHNDFLKVDLLTSTRNKLRAIGIDVNSMIITLSEPTGSGKVTITAKPKPRQG